MYGLTATIVFPMTIESAFSVFSMPVPSTVSPAETNVELSTTVKAVCPVAYWTSRFMMVWASFGVNVLAIVKFSYLYKSFNFSYPDLLSRPSELSLVVLAL